MNSQRRRFLGQSAVGGVGLATMALTPHSLWSAMAASAAGDGLQRNLVVIQLSGGNDGLNTVIPFADDVYQRNRLTLRYRENEVLRLDDYLAWHPAARGLADLLEMGRLAVVQGVGYPNPNRSHFESMDLWHTAHASSRATGWLGRYADQQHAAAGPTCVYVGSGVGPLALQAREAVPLTIRRLDQLRFNTEETRGIAEQLAVSSPHDDDLLASVAANLRTTLQADRQLAAAVADQSDQAYPASQLGRDLSAVATLIRSGFSARVYYVTLDGFDTHANQRGAHAALLEQLGNGLRAFCEDLQADGLLDQTLVMSFSEFGRRVKENGSQGTDHGVAGPLFVAGGSVQGGVLGEHPSLTDLVEGDLKHRIDYRSVYRTIIEGWFSASADAILSDEHEALKGLLKTG